MCSTLPVRYISICVEKSVRFYDWVGSLLLANYVCAYVLFIAKIGRRGHMSLNYSSWDLKFLYFKESVVTFGIALRCIRRH